MIWWSFKLGKRSNTLTGSVLSDKANKKMRELFVFCFCFCVLHQNRAHFTKIRTTECSKLIGKEQCKIQHKAKKKKTLVFSCQTRTIISSPVENSGLSNNGKHGRSDPAPESNGLVSRHLVTLDLLLRANIENLQGGTSWMIQYESSES